jgi:hypothetical protein
MFGKEKKKKESFKNNYGKILNLEMNNNKVNMKSSKMNNNKVNKKMKNNRNNKKINNKNR